MAWIVKLLPPPRTQTRWQSRYRDGTTQRSAGMYPTKTAARSVQHAIEHGDHVAYSDQLSPSRDPCCSASTSPPSGGPRGSLPIPSADGTTSKLTARILPRFGNLPLAQLDTHVVAAWQRDNDPRGPVPPHHCDLPVAARHHLQRRRRYRLPRPLPLTVPGRRRRRSATLTATPTEPSLPRMIWLTRSQVHQLADAVDPATAPWSSWRPTPAPAGAN
jgi:hypothetical protein